MKSIIYFNIALLLFLTSAAHGQENLLTISEAVGSAFDRNTELQQMRAVLRQKQESWRTETGIGAPEISYFREGIQTGPEDLFDEQRIAISQELDFPLTTFYRLKAAKQSVISMEYQIKALEREVKAAVKSSYIEVVYALHLQKSRAEQLEISTDLYNAVYTRFETGMATGVDLANAELQLQKARNDLDNAEWILHKARYGLFQVMGLPVADQKYTIEFSDTLRAEDIEISQIQSLGLQGEQPEYRAIEHELNSSLYDLREARSNILPDIRLSMYKQDFGEGYNYSGFEVGLSIPIWYPLEQKGNINKAIARKDELGWKQTEVELNMKKQIEYAWHNYSVSRKIVERYNSTMKEKAAKLRSMALRAYQLGEIDLLNLLNAQKTYIDSEQQYLEALRDYFLQLVALEKYFASDLVY
ncbi:MAG: TolC family protein [Marinilabiliaceae bacterium]|jgi:cobalt-zinc-cadmium efflux system outer membrane protein|nr:TolC family protein [Marinilabiliaceae bacterium]